jgi:hypothetical protein
MRRVEPATGDSAMSDDNVSRRDALRVIAAGTAGALPIGKGLAHDHGHSGGPQQAAAGASAEAKFFSAAQLATIAAVTERIIPSDERSPGAREAGVAQFIDSMIAISSDEVKSLWRDGLRELDERSRKDHAAPFASATAEQQTALLADLASRERRPATLLDRFFRSAKNLTVDGYYTSEIGLQRELRYKGNAYLKDFKGCTHPEHQA